MPRTRSRSRRSAFTCSPGDRRWQAVDMGYTVTVRTTMASSPRAHVIDALDHQFEAIEHEPGSKTVTIVEHVGMPDEADAVAFVRQLISDALPDGSKIVEVT